MAGSSFAGLSSRGGRPRDVGRRYRKNCMPPDGRRSERFGSQFGVQLPRVASPTTSSPTLDYDSPLGVKQMNADILEQVVEEYLQHRGYFTMHNVRFKPDRKHAAWNEKEDCVSSDVDVVGANPLHRGAERVWVISCKAWQSGFHARSKMAALEKSISIPSTNETVGSVKFRPRAAWKFFR